MTNLHAGVKCDTCPQNTPLHPPEQPPVNSTIPTGGGFRIVEPNKVGHGTSDHSRSVQSNSSQPG